MFLKLTINLHSICGSRIMFKLIYIITNKMIRNRTKNKTSMRLKKTADDGYLGVH